MIQNKWAQEKIDALNKLQKIAAVYIGTTRISQPAAIEIAIKVMEKEIRKIKKEEENDGE